MTNYQDSALLYVKRGWSPVPMTTGNIAGAKGQPLTGYTGHDGAVVDATNVGGLIARVDLASSHPDVSVRAYGWVGLDVDDGYAGPDGTIKQGVAQLTVIESVVGRLPPTYYSTARGPGPSGIRIYRTPAGLLINPEGYNFDLYGTSIEVIRFEHRYAKCWPTIHPNGSPYRWYSADGFPLPPGDVPALHNVPALPPEWLEWLTTDNRGRPAHTLSERPGELRSDTDRVFRNLGEVEHFLTAHRDRCLTTPEGSGFNQALNDYGHALTSFIPEFYTEDEARDKLNEVVVHWWPSGPDAADRATIRSAIEKSRQRFYGRRPTEAERMDPFSDYHDVEAILKHQGPETPRRGGTALATKPTRTPIDVAPTEGVFLSEEFWNARPLFGHLRLTAQAALQSPEGVLTAALALTMAHAMPNVVLPACVGVEASLNLMVVMVGDPGDGKSVCRKLARNAIRFLDDVLIEEFNPSSGQGVSGQYQRLVKVKGGADYMEPTKFRAMAVVEESETISALTKVSGNTLASELRKAAMGESLGFANIGDTKTNLPEGTYRFVLLMCMQPELSGWLMDESAGGLPQRFLWTCVRDPRVVRGIAKQPGNNGTPGWPLKMPFESTPEPMGDRMRDRYVMGIPDAICEWIVEATIVRKERGRDAGTDFDGHAILLRLKVAGGLALMDQRVDINLEDWALAGELAAMSVASRAWTQANLDEMAARKNKKMATAQGHAEVTKSEIVTGAAAARERARCRANVLRYLQRVGTTGMTKTDIRRKLEFPLRGYLDGEDGVLDALLAAGLVRFEDVLRAETQIGSRWFLA